MIDTKTLRAAGIHGIADELDRLYAEVEGLRKDAERYVELCANPVGGAHLLNLLAAGKGDQKALGNMIDRIRASRLKAIQAGIDAATRRAIVRAAAEIGKVMK